MPAGFEAYSASGQLIHSITDRLTRRVGSVTTGNANGSVNLGSGSPSTIWWTATPVGSSGGFPPVISCSGSTISWDYLGLGSIGMNIVIEYGFY